MHQSGIGHIRGVLNSLPGFHAPGMRGTVLVVTPPAAQSYLPCVGRECVYVKVTTFVVHFDLAIIVIVGVSLGVVVMTDLL